MGCINIFGGYPVYGWNRWIDTCDECVRLVTPAEMEDLRSASLMQARMRLDESFSRDVHSIAIASLSALWTSSKRWLTTCARVCEKKLNVGTTSAKMYAAICSSDHLLPASRTALRNSWLRRFSELNVFNMLLLTVDYGDDWDRRSTQHPGT